MRSNYHNIRRNSINVSQSVLRPHNIIEILITFSQRKLQKREKDSRLYLTRRLLDKGKKNGAYGTVNENQVGVKGL